MEDQCKKHKKDSLNYNSTEDISSIEEVSKVVFEQWHNYPKSDDNLKRVLWDRIKESIKTKTDSDK